MRKMAGCYHDTQDFKSNLNIEIARECDILEAGQDLKDRKCDKNPGHRGFIPFKDLTLRVLPIEHRNREIFDQITNIGNLVVRVVLDKKRMARGGVVKFNNKYFIQTKNHFVDDDDVKYCTVEFDYADDSRSSPLTSRGVEIVDTYDTDTTTFTFHPVPDFLDQEWMDFGPLYILKRYKNDQIETEIKLFNTAQCNCLSTHDLNSSLIDLMFVTCTDGSVSYIKSCYLKFQPIPSNIQQLTSIDIHIDEDNGNSRVIPGDVLKFGDDLVVEISESIFQDEVKKCRLVWSSEVIGHGTRLYFKQVKSSEISIGVDLKDLPDTMWLFEFHPKPNFIKRLVKLVVDKTKMGSGCAGKKMNNEYVITTNNHVVATDDDVKHCTVQFHYNDSNDRSSIIECKGLELYDTCPYRDITNFKFHPVPKFLDQHDWIGMEPPSIVIMYTNGQIKIAKTTHSIAHDKAQFNHLCDHDLNSSLIKLMFLKWTDGSISYIKSSYFNVQPIPSNIQELTSIEIHKDEDDGKSRVIPGDVVNFGDEFIFKISESIFQNEVKKCRLVLNGEVIGYGTRLYFQHVKSRDCFSYVSGIDLEHYVEKYPNGVWKFDSHPIPIAFKSQKAILNVDLMNTFCCIGHPHGGIKMVTFGRFLKISKERFDNQYRHITQPKPDCQCKEVSCFSYTSKTCSGSSGSPVFVLFEGKNWFAIYNHFMGESLEVVLPNGELGENKNMAWFATR